MVRLQQILTCGIRLTSSLCLSVSILLAGDLEPVPESGLPNLYRHTDTCNAYVLRDGNQALLIDFGAGDVTDALREIGVESIDWVLLTHHHREQCQGLLHSEAQPKIAISETEQPLLETPLEFRKWFPKLGDQYSVYGASYVRPPALPIQVSKPLKSGEKLEWHGHTIECVETPGHSPGSMTYCLTTESGKRIGFTGDLIHDGAKMVTWFDTEWDYGFGKGIETLQKSVDLAIEQNFDVVLPSHGPIIQDAKTQLATYRRKLNTFLESYLRGYPVFDLTNEQRDSLSKPTRIPELNQVTPHLYKLSDSKKGRNFAIIIADSGHALVLDCGLFPEEMLDGMIVNMRNEFGLKQIDAFWISHMHGDHFLLGPVLKEKYGAEAWTLDKVVDRCENPRRYDYAALISAYGDGFDGMKIEKGFKDGESIEWEGYRIQVDWMPGQTEFGCCLWLELDGKRIAFTGDNLFGTTSDPDQDGHECVVARNSSILEEGYNFGSKYLLELKPDIVMGSHSFVMDDPQAFLERYHNWSEKMISLYKDILPEQDYEYLYDPYWVSAYPYRLDLSRGAPATVEITVRNFRNDIQHHRIEFRCPPGIRIEPPVLNGTVDPESRATFPVAVYVDRQVAAQGMQMIPMDISLDGQHYGEWFDFLIRTTDEGEQK